MSASASCTEATSLHFHRASPAAVRAAWMDHSRRVKDIAAEFGMCHRALRMRAKGMGLPVRSKATKLHSVSPDQEPVFIALWDARVSLVDMAAFFRVCQTNIVNTRLRLGLPDRGRGARPRATVATIIAELQQSKLARAMAASASIEQAAMINAEMADRNSCNRMVGFKQARELL